MSASGSVPRDRDSLHPLLAFAAVPAGVWLMMKVGPPALAAAGLRLGFMTMEVFLMLPGILLLAASRIPLNRGLALVPVRPRTAVFAIAAGATLWAASLGLMNLQFSVWRPPQEFLDTFQQLHEALRPRGIGGALFSVAAIAVAPAVCEEVLFRGVVLPSFARFGAAAGLLGSAVLFALIHIDATPAGAVFAHRLPFTFTVGIGLGLLRLVTGSLLPAMAAHAAINTITFLTVLATGATADPMEEPQLALGIGLLLGGGAATGLLLRGLRRATLAS